MTTWMHEQRMEAVLEEVSAARATTVLDLGCGDGDLFLRLAAQPAITRLVGLDICAASLARLETRLATAGPHGARIDLHHASLTDAQPALKGFDCAVMVEVIEHVAPSHLSRLERSVFGQMTPGSVVITTPNAEFNRLLGVPAHRFRHPGHRFEWSRVQFRTWAGRVAASFGYAARTRDMAGCHPDLGGASQMAVFTRQP